MTLTLISKAAAREASEKKETTEAYVAAEGKPGTQTIIDDKRHKKA